MRRFPFSDDGLISGDLEPDDAPPEFARIAGLIQAARAPGTQDELAGKERIVSQMAAVVRESRRAEAARDDRRHVLGKVLSAKVIGASAAVLLSGGVAAAATGALPTPVQEAVSHGLRHIGVSVPNPAAHPPPATHSETRASGVTTTNTSTRSSTSSTTHPSNSANRYGLCNAYEHATNAKARSVALSRLSAPALAKGETVNAYCAGATPPSNSSGANPGLTHRPTTTSVPSSNQVKSHGHAPNGRGVQHRPTTAPSGRSSDSHAGKTNGNAATGSTHTKSSKSTTVSSARPGSSHGASSTSSVATADTTTTTTSLPATAQGHGSGNRDVGKGVSSAHTP
jgi:hypothetical protein